MINQNQLIHSLKIILRLDMSNNSSKKFFNYQDIPL